jgi:hypothetical protein
VTLTLLRLLQFRLQASGDNSWWLHPPWNRRKTQPSVRDVERLLRQHRGEIQQLLSTWLEKGEKAADEAKEEVVM